MITFNLTEGVRIIVIEKGDKVTRLDNRVLIWRRPSKGYIEGVPASELTGPQAIEIIPKLPNGLPWEFSKAIELVHFYIRTTLQSNGLELRKGDISTYDPMCALRTDQESYDASIPLSNIFITGS
jgi:hypothetical protein